jgi:hypothetical protein
MPQRHEGSMILVAGLLMATPFSPRITPTARSRRQLYSQLGVMACR